MQHINWTRAVGALFATTAVLGVGYTLGTHHAAGWLPEPISAASSDDGPTSPDRKILYWHDPMMPSQHFDKPGKSPFMDMALVPVYADEGGATGIKIDSSLQQNLGIRYATVRQEDIKDGFDAVGTTQFDESRTDVVQSRVPGYIDHLYASAPLQRIAKGAPIASLFVPDWLAPQEEYLALKRGHADPELLAASRARMHALSIPATMVSALEKTGKSQSHLILYAPRAGVVSELNVRDGAQVTPGQTLAKVAGLDELWLVVEVPESMALQVRPGMEVKAEFSGDSSRHFTGRVREILPGISVTSRTLQVRLEIDNPGLAMTPGMLMRARMSAERPATRLLVPSEAVITTGKRSIVIIRNSDGRLQPVEVKRGIDAGANTEILSGLAAGQQVVASGQFLIDSEANLKSVLPMLQGVVAGGADVASPAASPAAAPTPAPAKTVATYETTGKVEQVSASGVTFSHQPVAALHWPAMTMTFNKPTADAFPDVKVGQTMHFVFKQSSTGYELTQVDPITRGAQ